MRCCKVLATMALIGSLVPLLQADESVFVKGKDKPVKTVIKSESGLGVQGSVSVPAEDINDIEYELNPTAVRIGIYRKARDMEKESQDKETARKANIASAILQYEDALAKMAKGQATIQRNIEYRIAVLRTRQALEFGMSTDLAESKLNDFKSKHPDSWQISHCLRLLASLELSQKKFAQAEKTYRDLSAASVSDEAKQEGAFLAAQVNIQAGNYDKALKELRDLATKLPKDSRFGMRAKVAEAECLAVANKTAEANKLLQQLLKESTDKTLKAMAYNTLGKNLFKAGQFKEARWEFLWVDVVYNQDKGEHAKALYYLSQVFDKLGEADRAQECREQLLNDRQFAGLEFQRLAQSEFKSP